MRGADSCNFDLCVLVRLSRVSFLQARAVKTRCQNAVPCNASSVKDYSGLSTAGSDRQRPRLRHHERVTSAGDRALEGARAVGEARQLMRSREAPWDSWARIREGGGPPLRLGPAKDVMAGTRTVSAAAQRTAADSSRNGSMRRKTASRASVSTEVKQEGASRNRVMRRHARSRARRDPVSSSIAFTMGGEEVSEREDGFALGRHLSSWSATNKRATPSTNGLSAAS